MRTRLAMILYRKSFGLAVKPIFASLTERQMTFYPESNTTRLNSMGNGFVFLDKEGQVSMERAIKDFKVNKTSRHKEALSI
jgi:hypothetical protein